MTDKILEPGTISVDKFTRLLLEGDMSVDFCYNGDGIDFVNWFYDHMEQVKALANIHGHISFAYGGGNGTTTIRIVGITAAVIKAGETHYYIDMASALGACEAGDILRLREDLAEPITVSEKLILDLNGYNITGDIIGAENLYIMDSQTDDYYVRDTAGYGIVSGTVSGAEPVDGYVPVTEADGTSYHKVGVQLKQVNLKAADTGVYYTGKFRYDEVVARYLETTGVTLSTENAAPVADDSDPTSCYTISENSVLVKNILTKGAANNASRAKTPIYARAYLKMADGRIVYSETTTTNLKTLVETVDTVAWARLTDVQKETLKTMYATFADIMGSWKINHLKNA
jgi:hypothetical protein